MRTRQSILVAIVPMNIEPAEPIHTLQLAKAIERHLTSISYKLQKLGSLLFVE